MEKVTKKRWRKMKNCEYFGLIKGQKTTRTAVRQFGLF